MPPSKVKKAPRDLREELLKLRHADKNGFLRLISEMVQELEDPGFREVAALYSSWPVNVPAIATRGTRKIVPGPPKRTWVILRESKCHQVLDEQLLVGSGLVLNLFPAKCPKLDDPMTGLAYEVAVFMAAVHAGNIDANSLRDLLGIRPHKKRRMRMLQEWCDSVKGLSRSGPDARSKWAYLGFRFAQLRYRRSLKNFTGLHRWLEKLSGKSKSLHSKTRRGREGVLKSKFAQAVRPFLKLE